MFWELQNSPQPPLGVKRCQWWSRVSFPRGYSHGDAKIRGKAAGISRSQTSWLLRKTCQGVLEWWRWSWRMRERLSRGSAGIYGNGDARRMRWHRWDRGKSVDLKELQRQRCCLEGTSERVKIKAKMSPARCHIHVAFWTSQGSVPGLPHPPEEEFLFPNPILTPWPFPFVNLLISSKGLHFSLPLLLHFFRSHLS